MKKIKPLLPILALLLALHLVTNTQGSIKRVTYYEYSTTSPSTCVVSLCSLDGPIPCGHMGFVAGPTSNCDFQVVLKQRLN